jgi:hypothetical protein
MRFKVVVLFALALGGAILAIGTVPAAENKGAENMMLAGGSRGEVPFPHLQHQNNLEDCQTCHDLFPQRQGAIEALKSQGKLESKQVMNQLCTGCHREKRRAGEPTGPITCSDCHVRN